MSGPARSDPGRPLPTCRQADGRATGPPDLRFSAPRDLRYPPLRKYYRALAARYGLAYREIDRMTRSEFYSALAADDDEPGGGGVGSFEEARRLGWIK